MGQNNESESPWLKIPYDDYERHMGLPDVAQLKILSSIFSDVVELYNPRSLALIGCATGNGFENLEGMDLNKVVGVDINPDYIHECRRRYEHKINSLELHCGDLLTADLPDNYFDLIHAALLFEYADVEKSLAKMTGWLKKEGILSVVLQLPSSESASVSETPFDSIRSLIPYIKLVDVDKFLKICGGSRLKLEKEFEVDLPKGKKFLVLYFRK